MNKDVQAVLREIEEPHEQGLSQAYGLDLIAAVVLIIEQRRTNALLGELLEAVRARS